jgi:hypothetical protein
MSRIWCETVGDSIASFELPQAPTVGEHLRYDGLFFVVKHVTWCLDDVRRNFDAQVLLTVKKP